MKPDHNNDTNCDDEEAYTVRMMGHNTKPASSYYDDVSNNDDTEADTSKDHNNPLDYSTADYARVLHYGDSESDDDNDSNASEDVEGYPNTSPDEHELEIEAVMLMYATSRKETQVNKRFVDCSLRATYKIKSTLAITVKVIIPATVAAAINDKEFSFKWRMAIQNELQNKITNEYKFEAVSTQQSRMIVRGMWIFETTQQLTHRQTQLTSKHHG